jgi:quinol monooxygenase YgiN
MVFAYSATFVARRGHRDELASILREGFGSLSENGCRLYLIAAGSDDVTLTVTELWDSREQHDASLQNPATREAIGRALPLLATPPSGGELRVLGVHLG